MQTSGNGWTLKPSVFISILAIAAVAGGISWRVLALEGAISKHGDLNLHSGGEIRINTLEIQFTNIDEKLHSIIGKLTIQENNRVLELQRRLRLTTPPVQE